MSENTGMEPSLSHDDPLFSGDEPGLGTKYDPNNPPLVSCSVRSIHYTELEKGEVINTRVKFLNFGGRAVGKATIEKLNNSPWLNYQVTSQPQKIFPLELHITLNTGKCKRGLNSDFLLLTYGDQRLKLPVTLTVQSRIYNQTKALWFFNVAALSLFPLIFYSLTPVMTLVDFVSWIGSTVLGVSLVALILYSDRRDFQGLVRPYRQNRFAKELLNGILLGLYLIPFVLTSYVLILFQVFRW